MPSNHLPRRIVILVHARDREATERAYQIWDIADVWRSWGIEVVVQHGIDRHVDADVIVNHVDLTVVPSGYVAYLNRYPVAINGRCVDISKRVVSANLVRRGDGWSGPVIVKTDRNYGGELEWQTLRSRPARAWDALRMRITRHPWRIRRLLSTHDYPVFESASDVPADVWRNRHLVVERFLPEREGELYAVRKLAIFGDRWVSRRAVSESPVIKSDNSIRVDDVEPHPEALAFARRFGLDRGRLDYVLDGDRAVVLDVNRTNTMGSAMMQSRVQQTAEHLAPGLLSFWPPAGAA